MCDRHILDIKENIIMESVQHKLTRSVLKAPQKTRKPTNPRRSIKKKDDGGTNEVRNHLAVLITSLLVILALIAAIQSGAMTVIQLLLPLVGTIFGFYFGYKAGRIER
jgi:hypothetical protein